MSDDTFLVNFNEINLNEINVNEISRNDCFICFEELNTDFIILKCCNQPIHKNCLFDVILFVNNTCPMCRNERLNTKEYLTLDDMILFFNKLELNQKKERIHIIKELILYHFKQIIKYNKTTYNIKIIPLYSIFINNLYIILSLFVPCILLILIIILFIGPTHNTQNHFINKK